MNATNRSDMADVFDVGRARLRHTQPVEAEQHGERDVGSVVLLSYEQEPAEFTTIHGTVWDAHPSHHACAFWVWPDAERDKQIAESGRPPAAGSSLGGSSREASRRVTFTFI